MLTHWISKHFYINLLGKGGLNPMAKTKFIGSKNLIDPNTGELIPMNMVEVETQGRKNFYICYMYNMMKLFDVLGGKKYKLLEFIIDNMNSDNQLVMTTREIKEKTGISTQTIIDTLKILEQNNLIIRKVGSIMLNPKLINNKSACKEEYMVIKYNQIKSDNQSHGKTNNKKEKGDN